MSIESNHSANSGNKDGELKVHEVLDEISDEKKVRQIVRDLLLNQNKNHWGKVVPELDTLVSKNTLNTELLFPLMVFIHYLPVKEGFRAIAIPVVEKYGLIYKENLYTDERRLAAFKFSFYVSMANRNAGLPALADLLENYSLSDLTLKFPDLYSEAENFADQRFVKKGLTKRGHDGF